MTDKAEDRIVEMTFKFIDGNTEEFAEWLQKIGATIKRRSEDEIIFDGPSGVGTGLFKGIDPINAAVCVAFAVAGVFWPFVFPNLLKKVEKEWKERLKQRRRT